MLDFQLDECINAKSLAKDCNSQGLAVVHRYPESLNNQSVKDPEMIEFFVKNNRVLLTVDKRIASDHIQDIPLNHPGMVIIDRNDGLSMDTAEARRILHTFKLNNVEWHRLNIKNSILILTKEKVTIYHRHENLLLLDLSIYYIESDFGKKFSEIIDRNQQL